MREGSLPFVFACPGVLTFQIRIAGRPVACLRRPFFKDLYREMPSLPTAWCHNLKL